MPDPFGPVMATSSGPSEDQVEDRAGPGSATAPLRSATPGPSCWPASGSAAGRRKRLEDLDAARRRDGLGRLGRRAIRRAGLIAAEHLAPLEAAETIGDAAARAAGPRRPSRPCAGGYRRCGRSRPCARHRTGRAGAASSRTPCRRDSGSSSAVARRAQRGQLDDDDLSSAARGRESGDDRAGAPPRRSRSSTAWVRFVGSSRRRKSGSTNSSQARPRALPARRGQEHLRAGLEPDTGQGGGHARLEANRPRGQAVVGAARRPRAPRHAEEPPRPRFRRSPAAGLAQDRRVPLTVTARGTLAGDQSRQRGLAALQPATTRSAPKPRDRDRRRRWPSGVDRVSPEIVMEASMDDFWQQGRSKSLSG